MSDWTKELARTIGTNTFRQLTAGVGMVVCILLIAGLRRVWPDCPPSGYAVLLLGAIATVSTVALLVKAITGSTDLLFDFTAGQWRLVIVGFAVALALASGLFAYEWNGQRTADAMRAQGQADQEAYAAKLKAIGPINLPPRR